MNPLNKFSFIGTIYDKGYVETKRSNTIKYVLCVENTYKEEPTYIPILCQGDIAQLSTLICDSGNKVAVYGEVVSRKKYDYEMHKTSVEIFFIVKKMMLITKMESKKINLEEIDKTIELYDLGNYVAPKPRNVCINGDNYGKK